MSKFFANVGEKDYINITQKTAIWDFLEEYLKPSGWVVSLARRSKIIPDAPLLIDCGAISYRKAEIPYIRGEQVNPYWVINQAKLIANSGDIICAPDHLLLQESNLKFRRKFNQENAVNFLELAKQELASGIIPMAVCHGLSVEERVEYARWLYKIGYRCIGIGGLVPLASNTKYCQTVVREIRKSLPSDCQLHVLGLSSPAYAATWNELGIDSFDGRTYQLEAIQGEIYETVGCTIKRHRIARIGKPIAAPLCYCPVCVRLRKEGLDSRISGTRLSTLALPQLLSIPDKLYTTRAPLAGLGIGYQMQWLKQKTPKYKHLQLALL